MNLQTSVATVARSSDPPALVVYSTLSAKEALKELVPAFEQHQGQRLDVVYAGGSALAKQLTRESAGDLFIGPEEFTRNLVANGVLHAGQQQALALSSTALVISAHAVVPETRTVGQVRDLLLQARSFCYSPGASGIFFARLLEQMGIAAAMASKTVRPGTGELVGGVVARGGAELGVQQISELLPVPGIRVLTLPAELRQSIVYLGSLFTAARQPEAALAFVDFLRSADAGHVWRQKGLEPM